MSVMQTEMASDDNIRMEWDPFSDDQVDGLFFPGAGRSEMQEQLLHLLRYGSALTVLVGEAGVGKRVLLAHLREQLDPDLFDVADIQADVMMTFEQLLQQLDDPWRSLRPFTRENFQELVPAVAAAADNESKTLLCIIRDAHQLSPDVLGQLQALLAASSGLPVKCLLVAAVSELEHAGAIHDWIAIQPESHVLYLDPFTQEQVADYIQYRMHTAGLGQVTFNPQQIERIFNQSLGNPARVNAAAREVLLEALPAPNSSAPVRRLSLPLPLMHIAALGVLIVAVILFWQMESPTAPGTPQKTIVLDHPIAEAPAPAPTPAVTSPFTRMAQEQAEPNNAVGEPVVAGNTPEAVSSAVVAPAPSQPAAEPARPAAEEPPAAAVSAAEQKTPAPPVAATPKPAPVPAVSKPEPSSVAASADPREAWLLGLAPDHYMLQLMSAQEKSTMDRFLSQNPGLKRVVYYRTLRKGQHWYIVVQGDYPDYDAAKTGIAQLPAGVRKENPWVRKVSGIQQEMKAR